MGGVVDRVEVSEGEVKCEVTDWVEGLAGEAGGGVDIFAILSLSKAFFRRDWRPLVLTFSAGSGEGATDRDTRDD